MYFVFVGKITGMLLEIDNIELRYMFEFLECFYIKVDEVIVVL